MTIWNKYRWIVTLLVLAALNGLVYSSLPAEAATPAKEPVAVPCDHVATADSIKIYFCDDIDLFVNQLGFMTFEP